MESDGDWTLRLLRERLLGNLPSEAAMFVAIARELERRRQGDEAEAMRAAMTRLFPVEPDIWIDWAEAPERGAEWAEALRRWHEARERFPGSPQPLLGAARALRELGRMQEADALFETAQEAFPDDLTALIGGAEAAARRRDWEEAQRRWEDVQRRHPRSVHGYLGAARATRDMGDADAADRLFMAAVERFPQDRGLLNDWAMSAVRRRDWEEAQRRWAVLIARHPNALLGHHGAARLLRDCGKAAEADAMFADLVIRFPTDWPLHADWADSAMRRRDLEEAHRRWLAVRSTFSHAPAAHLGVAVAARELGRLDEADLAYATAAERFPNDLSVQRLWADSAMRRKQWDEAERRWAVVAERFPRVAAGQLGHARCLREAGRREEAEAAFLDATKRFPADAEAWIGWADSAERAPDQPEALRRWEQVRTRFPQRSEGFVRAADVLRRAARHDEASALLELARERFPSDQGVLHRSALQAEAKRDWPAAGHFFNQLHEHNPNDRLALGGVIRSQLRTPDVERATRTCDAALRRFPDDLSLRSLWVEVAIARGDFVAAAETWRDIKNTANLPETVAGSLHRLRWRFLDFSVDPEVAAEGAQAAGASLKEIVQSFESLGGMKGGCDFGIFQRSYGAEPLGLLRWASIHPNELIEGLDAGFEGIGSPDRTILEEHTGEYMTIDRRFGMRTHTFVTVSETPRDVMLRRVTTRLRFLRGKLLEDLKSPEKLFLYKYDDGPLPDDKVAAIGDAIGRHGPCTLICVRRADAANPFPSVKWLRPRLMVGHMDRFANVTPGVVADRNHGAWEQVIRNAFSLWLAARSA